MKFQRVPLAAPGPCESVGTASRPESAERELVRIFASSLRVKSLVEAQPRLGGRKTNDIYRVKLLSVVRAMLEPDPDDGISADELRMVSGLSGEGVCKALHDLEYLGIANYDTVLAAFDHWGVRRASEVRFRQAADLKKATIDLLCEAAPDMGVGDSTHLVLRGIMHRLQEEGHSNALPERVRRILNSIAADGRGDGDMGGSLSVRGRDSKSSDSPARAASSAVCPKRL